MANYIKNIENLGKLQPADDCNVLKEVLNTMKGDIEQVLKKASGFDTNSGQAYVKAIFERINSTITILKTNDVEINNTTLPKVVPTVKKDSYSITGRVSNSLKEILEPLIKEGETSFTMNIGVNRFDPDDDSGNIRNSKDDPGIITHLIEVCEKVCKQYRRGGKSRRRSRKNKRTRKSKKKARRSKKARKTRK